MLDVSSRLVQDVGKVMSTEGPASTALQHAVREVRIKAGHAAKVVDQPAEVQDQALAKILQEANQSLSVFGTLAA